MRRKLVCKQESRQSVQLMRTRQSRNRSSNYQIHLSMANITSGSLHAVGQPFSSPCHRLYFTIMSTITSLLQSEGRRKVEKSKARIRTFFLKHSCDALMWPLRWQNRGQIRLAVIFANMNTLQLWRQSAANTTSAGTRRSHGTIDLFLSSLTQRLHHSSFPKSVL